MCFCGIRKRPPLTSYTIFTTNINHLTFQPNRPYYLFIHSRFSKYICIMYIYSYVYVPYCIFIYNRTKKFHANVYTIEILTIVSVLF